MIERERKEREGEGSGISLTGRARVQVIRRGTLVPYTVHDPGGQTVAPGSVPPSVWLEGERNGLTSLNVEVDKVKVNGNHVEVNHETQKLPRGPVGTQDSDMCCPNEPTELPDKDEGARGGNGKVRVKSAEMKELRQGDQPGGRGVEETRSREVEGEAGDQNGVDNGQQDGRTNDTGSPTSGTSHAQLDVTETVRSYWGSVPEPPDPRTKSTEARTLTLYTIDTTHSTYDHQLPYWVITPA
ncbi:hypothetical protein BDN67DRAFT_984328 [Paxillus ammoniavirescens]|nr:hypothetical protein BDN67DRAFT_984328 [Paxillus ammoniavirescens]